MTQKSCSSLSTGIESTQRGSTKSKALFVNLKQRLVKVRKERRTRFLYSILCGVSSLFHHPIFYPTVRCAPWPLFPFTHESVKYDVHSCMDRTTIKHLKYSQAKLDDLFTFNAPPTERALFLPCSARHLIKLKK